MMAINAGVSLLSALTQPAATGSKTAAAPASASKPGPALGSDNELSKLMHGVTAAIRAGAPPPFQAALAQVSQNLLQPLR